MTSSSKAPLAIAVMALGMAVVLGAVGSVLGVKITLLMLAGALPLPIILRDYRIGVMLMVLVLPSSTMLPPISGLNLLNFLTGATLGSFVLKKAFGHGEWLSMPRAFFWGFFLPVTVAIIVAYPHIHEGARNYYLLEKAAIIYEPNFYVSQRYIKPIFYFFSFAFLLGNAMKDSKHPERFLMLMVVSTIPPSLAVFYSVATYPGSFADVAANREFMAARGMHANEFGMLLAVATGPLLFMIGKQATRLGNLFVAGCFALVLVALLLTFSRGGLLAFLIMAGCYLVLAKRVKVIFITIGVAALGLMFAPDVVQERFSTGLREGAISDASNVRRDDLTAGRVAGWTLLAPEVLDSPIIGRGLGSTQWSVAVAQGRYRANHPHNIYLELLMDMGIVGFAMFAGFYVWVFRRYKAVAAASESLSPQMLAFCQGSRFALFGILAMAATTAYYMPNAAQTYIWFGFGVLIWARGSVAAAVPVAMPTQRARPRPARPRFTRQRWQDKVPR